MSNVELRPEEHVCAGAEAGAPPAGQVQLLSARDVPLGGPRAMTVRRTLPQRALSLIGAWCFVDHYGPDDVARTGGMNVPPHPHTGLATVSWLFSGQITHADSAGHRAEVGPGELSLMTAGSGISHSERSSGAQPVLHGVQMWVALPEADRFGPQRFEHYVPPVVRGPGWRAQVFLGSALGHASPVVTATGLLAAEISLDPGSSVQVQVGDFESGLLVDAGQVRMDGVEVAPDWLGYRPAGQPSVTLRAGEEPARMILFGGTPLEEEIVMWWNFVGRSHEEIVAYRQAWQEEISTADEGRTELPQFGLPDADPDPPLPAPELPNARIRPRRRPGS